MGGKSETVQESKQTKTEPWEPARPLLQGILGQLGGALDTTGLSATQSSALAGLEANARAGNPWAPQIAGVARDLLAGGPDRTGLVSDAYGAYRTGLEPTARGDYLDPNKNPFYSAATSSIGDDVTKRLAGMYAGAGRDPSGAAGFGTELAAASRPRRLRCSPTSGIASAPIRSTRRARSTAPATRPAGCSPSSIRPRSPSPGRHRCGRTGDRGRQRSL